MNRNRLLSTLVLSSLTVASLPLSAGAGDSLNVFRSEVRSPEAVSEPEPEPSESGRKRSRGHRHSDPCDDSISVYFGKGLVWGLTSPWWAPAAIVGDDYVETGYFASYPYAPSEAGPPHDGYLLFGPHYPATPYTWAGRVSGYYGDDFDSLSNVGGQIVLEHASRFGIDSTNDFRHQNLGAGLSDELWTGDFNFVYRFAQSERVQMRTGVGFNYLSDSIQSDFGFNFTYGGDLMLGDPWVLSAELDLGRLGEASVTHVRTTIGAVWHGVEVFTGFDYYEVGSADISSLISGVRIWF